MRSDPNPQPPAAAATHSYLRQALITLLAVAVLLGSLEIIWRIRAAREFGVNSYRSIALRDRFTAWRNNPAYGRVDRHINAQGFRRDREIPLEKPSNTVRIFLTGGSAAYGWSTGWPEIDSHSDRLYDNQTISYYLEQELNEAFPSKHWEVINAAVVGYELNLELAQTESVLLRYGPDGIIYLDGHNDLLSLLQDPSSNYDPYAATPTGYEFNLLANPGSLKSFLFFTATWIRENSVLFRSLMDHLQPPQRPPDKKPANAPHLVDKVRRFDLSPEEQARFDLAKKQLDFYPRFARQIHSILKIDGVRPLFLLQPELFLTRKPLTGTEQRLAGYQRNNPALLLFAFQELYPEIGARMAETAQQAGFGFENLVDVFDTTSQQMFTDDVHLTPEANRLIAGRLAPVVARMFGSPPGQ